MSVGKSKFFTKGPKKLKSLHGHPPTWRMSSSIADILHGHPPPWRTSSTDVILHCGHPPQTSSSMEDIILHCRHHTPRRTSSSKEDIILHGGYPPPWRISSTDVLHWGTIEKPIRNNVTFVEVTFCLSPIGKAWEPKILQQDPLLMMSSHVKPLSHMNSQVV